MFGLCFPSVWALLVPLIASPWLSIRDATENSLFLAMTVERVRMDRCVIRVDSVGPVARQFERLLSVSQQDIERRAKSIGCQPNAYASISAGVAIVVLQVHPDCRQMALVDFAKIQHPAIQIACAFALFDSGSRDQRVMDFIKQSIGQSDLACYFQSILGAGVDSFREKFLIEHALMPKPTEIASLTPSCPQSVRVRRTHLFRRR